MAWRVVNNFAHQSPVLVGQKPVGVKIMGVFLFWLDTRFAFVAQLADHTSVSVEAARARMYCLLLRIQWRRVLLRAYLELMSICR